MLFEGNMVGNMKVCKLDVVEKLKFEEENCLFTKFIIGTTMQDGSKRKEAILGVIQKFNNDDNDD